MCDHFEEKRNVESMILKISHDDNTELAYRLESKVYFLIWIHLGFRMSVPLPVIRFLPPFSLFPLIFTLFSVC